MNFVARWLQKQLELALAALPVVVLTGARQTGKSTMAQHLWPQRRYLTLDDLDLLHQAKHEPETLLVNPPMTIDEVQRAPELVLAIKRYVDKKRRAGDFLLTGSAQFSLMHDIVDSLAGRAAYLDLHPFAPQEWRGDASSLIDEIFSQSPNFDLFKDKSGSWQTWLLRGGFAPALHCVSDDSRSLWFGSYVKTYLERDLRQLSYIENLSDFQRLMQVAAQRTARIVNQADIARDAGLSSATCHRYLNLLETGCQIERIKAFTANPSLALVKSPKLLWCDSGLSAWLAGIDDTAGLNRRSDSGFWLEQAIFQSLQAWRSADPFKRKISYWRTRSGAEVDFVLEKQDRIVAMDIKMSSRLKADDIASVKQFMELHSTGSRPVKGIVLYGGNDIRYFGPEITALPYGFLFP
jgi:predicted AAA+ superfamily ATPase